MALQPLKTFLKEFLRKQKTTGPGRVLTQTEIDQRQEFLDKFLQYADEKFSGNFSAAAESLGESRERIRGFFQRQAGESRAYGKIAKGSEMQTTIEVPKKLIPYTEATTNVKYNQNFFKNKIKDFDKTKFYTPKDLANILDFDVSNKAVLDNFTADLKRFGVSTKQKTGQQKLYNLSSAANELTEGYQKKLVKGDRLSGSRRSEVIYKLDKPLNNYFSAFRNRLRNISKEKDVYVPSAGEDVGHPLSVKITDKFPKLTKNSNINKINTLVYQDPIVNRDVLVKTGYEAKHENLLKRLNKLLNKPLKEKDVLELQNVKQELNNLHTEVVDNIKELSKTDNYFKGQEQRIAKIDINIPEVGKKFKSEDLFVDMSNVNPAYKVGYIDNINPNAKFFNDLTKKQKQQYHSNVVDQNKNNLQRFYKEAGFDQESIEDLKDAIDFGTDSKLPLYFLSGTGVTAATGVAADDQTDLLEKGDIDYGDPETWNMKVGQFIEESPKLSATAAAATPLLTKPGRKLYGQAAKQILRGAGTPLGLVMANLGFGVDPASSLDRAVLGTELALSPFAVKEAAKFGPTAQRILNLGLSPTMALRAARFASPLGIATLVGEGGYQFYQALEDEKARIAAMSPEEREMFEQEQTAAAYMGEAENFAYGGRVGMAGGGLVALKALLNFLGKGRGKKGSELLQEVNPKKYGTMLENLMLPDDKKMVGGFRVEYLETLLDTIKNDKAMLDKIKQMPVDQQESFFNMINQGANQGRLDVYKTIDPDEAILEIEQMIKNLKTKDMSPEEIKRSLNAYGGRVGMKIGGDPKDKKKTPFDKPTLPIDPNAPQDPGRRTFMEGVGLGGLGIAGLLSGAIKFAPEIKKAVTGVTTQMTEVPNIVKELYATIKNLGQVTDYSKKGVVKTELGPYELNEYPGGYNITKKTDSDYRYQEESFEVQTDPEYGVIDYEELTVRPDMDGKLKDVDYGVELETYREIGEDLAKIKKDDSLIKIADDDIAKQIEKEQAYKEALNDIKPAREND
jgi:hypothetical protein